MIHGTLIHPPNYNSTMLYVYPEMVTANSSLQHLKEHRFIRMHNRACMTETSQPGHSKNQIHEMSTEGPFKGLSGTTFWINEWMQVGHTPFDSVLIQVLKSNQVDRIILQRAACTARLCDGVGNFRSFFAAYYAAAIAISTKTDIPLFMRWTKDEDVVKATYLSLSTMGYISNKAPHGKHPEHINLGESSCFERLIVRGLPHQGNFYGSKSPEAVQSFKAAAYGAASVSALNNGQPLPTSFNASSPYKILFSYRGRTHRHIENYPMLIDALQKAFPPSNYSLHLLNNGNTTLTAEVQIKAVASAHVVITNHGAFEGNLVYMRNSSLLVELCGNYENDDFKLFQNFSREFGLYYARLQGDSLTDHNQLAYNMSGGEIEEVVRVVRDYFDLKPFLWPAADATATANVVVNTSVNTTTVNSAVNSAVTTVNSAAMITANITNTNSMAVNKTTSMNGTVSQSS